ncbi:hypothetical protein CONLIGDRAFT_681851 [Coniochaeta ligniaria NRRL 30616]|uniref:Uncharacterized protein n=1 Tax=Coniochaeta ligniaria NRRL 30616 TaxID=1408157 RepID=A0A1J7JI06_9PEZI|nr:hypothetical protein CONLIGDRAFT_681851 [Coniochaeta ligniaria NRRL 30616]
MTTGMMTALLTRTALLLGLLFSIPHCAADFTGVSFDHITESGSLNLTWDNTGLDADSFPLAITISLINQTGSGVFGVKTNLSSSVNTTSYLWQGLPYPAPYLPTAQYQVEIIFSRANASNVQSVVARSPFFLIHQAPQPVDSSASDTSEEPASEGLRQGGLTKNTSIAIGVVVGVFSIMALGIVGWCFRRRQRRAREEARRRKRMEFVIS